MRWPSSSNRATNTPVDIIYSGVYTNTIYVNQTTNGAAWAFLGVFPCQVGTSSWVTIRNNVGKSGVVVGADAVEYVKQQPPSPSEYIVDNADSNGVSSTGSWALATLAGCYGSNSVYAQAINGSAPTATFTFTPTLLESTNYDIYMRCPSSSNRATNTPVDIIYSGVYTNTVYVNQTTNGAAWAFLGAFPCQAGTSNWVTIRNNAGPIGAYVGADVVEYVKQQPPSQPIALTPAPSAGPIQVALTWEAESNAFWYNIKRSSIPGGPHNLISVCIATNFTDTNVIAGAKYFYAITAVSGEGESDGFREIQASPSLISDNSDTVGVSSVGTWSVSLLSTCYGSNSVYSATTTSSSPTAAFSFYPQLPFFAHYDVYMRWPAYSNRATNTPVDVVYADGQKSTLIVNQTTNGGTWVLLGTFACEPGMSNSVIIRNNTGQNGKYVVADAVQFVPRLSPWGPRLTGLEDYTVTQFADEIYGTNLDPSLWSTSFLNRTNVTVGNGKIYLNLTYIGPGTAATASPADLKNPFNWLKGAVQPVDDIKFGYYESRYMIVTQGGGTDNAFWQNSIGSLRPIEDFEYDSPETISTNDYSNTAVGYGMWDHRGGDFAGAWRMNVLHENYNWVTNYHVWGVEWRVDNSIRYYLDGVNLFTAPSSAVNGMQCMAPVLNLLSTYPGNVWQPSGALDGQSMKVDYLRCYQKPGWLGAVSSDWFDARNWGPDGVPSAGQAAMFNIFTSRSNFTLSNNVTVQSICFDGKSVPGIQIDGPGILQLGAGSNSVIQGGIAVCSSVTNNQTINANILGKQDLSFLNNSSVGASLIFNGKIECDSANPPHSVRFAVNEPIVIKKPLGSTLGDIVKWGSVDFYIPTNSTYSGRTILAQGVIVFDQLANSGNPSGLGAPSSTNRNVLFQAYEKYSDETLRPRLRYTGPAASTDRGVELAYACDGVLEASGRGPVTWNGAVVFDPTGTSIGIFTLGGTNTGNNTYAGPISDIGSGVALRLRKVDSGVWILTGTNYLTYPVAVSNGTLLVNSPGILNGAVNVYSGVFGGNGTVNSNVTIYAGAIHAPGISPGIQTINGRYTINANALLNIEINGSIAGSQYDQIKVTGPGSTITLSGALQIVAQSGLSTNSLYTIINNQTTNAISGNFYGLTNNSTFIASGYTWKIQYNGGDGNDVTLAIIGTDSPMLFAMQVANTLPCLNTGVVSNGIQMTWPVWADKYTLLTSTGLGAAAVWTPVTNPIEIYGGTFRLIITNDAPQKYFRLFQP
jgi:hypothetical protein